MRSITNKSRLFIFLIVLACVPAIFGQETKATTFHMITANRYAPEFYADDLSVKAILVNLPGAATAGSTWMLSYEVYFLPEGQLREAAMAHGGRLGSETSPGEFPKRIFIGKGDINKKDIKTLANRTVVGENFKFKSKIPAEMQTEASDLMTVYTLKIYDAELKRSVLKTGLFFGKVFMGDRENKREKVFLNFYVGPKGDISTSQLERATNSTEW